MFERVDRQTAAGRLEVRGVESPPGCPTSDEPDYAIATFLMSVMGEGTFLSLLSFLERHGRDPVARRITHLTRYDEARHVGFAVAHLERHVALDPDLRPQLARAVEQRHRALRHTSGLNATSSTPWCCSPPAIAPPSASASDGTTCKRSKPR
jgi:hypothetical protein